MSGILLISPELWNGHFVSKQHYALEFARRGHEVVYCGPPEGGNAVRIEIAERGGARLRIVRGGPVGRGLAYWPAPLRNRAEASWLRRVEAAAGHAIDVVWLFENSRFFDMRFAGSRLKIYHQVDLNQDFHPAMAARTADLSIAVSQPIEDRLRGAARRLIRLPHGYADRPGQPVPEAVLAERFGGTGPHAVLTGNLDLRYLDVPLLGALVAGHPGVRFHFVGGFSPGNPLHAALAGARNAVFWGRQPAETLPSILARADVLLVAYRAAQHRAQLANPHKIMDYLASGKVILATPTLEYERRSDLVEMAADEAAFLAHFADIVARLPAFNAPERMERRRAFAQDNSYARHVARIAAALGDAGRLIA